MFHPVARCVVAYAVAVALLCAPALWNGFPLMFDDVGGYLLRWPTASLGIGRSSIYGLALWITRSGSFFPLIVLQALATVFVVDRAIRAFVVRAPSPWWLPGTIAAIAATSGAAFFAAKAIPDAWAAPGVLALHLLAWHSESLARWQRTALAAIVALAGATHMATFGVLAGLSALYAVAWLARRPLRLTPTGSGLAIAAVWAGLVVLLAGNFVVAGRIALPSEGDIFLFGRMVEDGMAGEILAEECPRPDWRLCDYRAALPGYQEAFIFDADGPLQKIGGEDDPGARREIAAIIARSLARHPLAHAWSAITLTASQFVDLGTGGVMEPLLSWHTRWALTRYAPGLVAGFDAARQQTEVIDLGPWSDWVVVPVSITASLALPGIGVLLWRAGHRRDAMLPAFLFLALLGNAAVCGVVSSPNDRYQARLAWLATMALGLTIPGLARQRRNRLLPISPVG